MSDSGIYAIICRPTGDCYVGKAKSIKRRIAHHKTDLRAGRHTTPKLQAAFSRHGESSFAFQVLERCDPSALDDKEHDWMVRIRPSFNVATPDYLAIAKGDAKGKRIARRREKQNLEPSRYICACGNLKSISSRRCLGCSRLLLMQMEIAGYLQGVSPEPESEPLKWKASRHSAMRPKTNSQKVAQLKRQLGPERYRAALLVLGHGLLPSAAGRRMGTSAQHVSRLLAGIKQAAAISG